MVKLFVLGLFLVVLSRGVGLRVAKRRWPEHEETVVAASLVAQHALLALAFALMAYWVAAADLLRIVVSALMAVFALYETVFAGGMLYVLVRPPESLAD
jgi:hypothetical protein